jgi:tetratricopeptide (TPR) repeat protein
MNFRILLPAVMVSMLAACAPTPESVASREVASPPALRESQALCLAASDGDGAVERALRIAQAAAQTGQPNPQHWITIGSHWLRKARHAADPGYYLNVEACIDEALALDPADGDALALRSLVLLQDHQFAAARTQAERVLAAEPQHVLALGALSDAALELGDYVGALRAAQRQMAARPGMVAETRAAHLAFLHGENDRAKTLIRDALHGRSRSDPEAAAFAFVEAARIFWHEGDLDGADAVLVEAMSWLPDYPPALVLRARIALANDDARAAIDLATRAHAQRPLVESAWLLSDAHALGGDPAAADEWFERARQLGEQSDHLGLGQLLAARGVELDRALAALEGERAQRGGIALDDAYAWALYRAGRIEEAAHFSAQALRLGTRDARLLYHAGAIRMALGESTQARALLSRALALNPRFDPHEADAAQRLLAADLRAVQR